jgi:nucleoside-diphosphate-sugar epimerase
LKVKHLLIIGAGYTGLELARQALARGLRVTATSRSVDTLEALDALGAEGVRWDVLADSPEVLDSYLGPTTAVVYSVPTLFDEYEPAVDTVLARHVEPVARLLDRCVTKGAARFIYLSATSVYGDHDGRWIDEEAELKPDSPAGMMRRDIELHVLGRGDEIDVNVARIVGIYGPGRTTDRYIASGRYRLVNGGIKPTNRIHVEDLATSIIAMVEKGPKGARAYNVCDGHPTTVREIVEYVCERTGLPMPPQETLESYTARVSNPDAVGRWKNAIRCKNARLLEELGVELRYPDVFQGYEALIRKT